MSVCRLCLYVAIAGPEQQLYQLEREQESPAVFTRSVLYLRILWHYTATVFDFGVTNDREKFVTEICIPVKCESEEKILGT